MIDSSNRGKDYKSYKLFQQKKYFDLTTPITTKTVVFPGDPRFKTEDICSLAVGDTYALKHIHLGNHLGTHIDFPAHVIQDGKTSSDFNIENLIGTGLIIEVPEAEKSITKAFVEKIESIRENDFVFFKTKNSKISKQEIFTEEYVYIDLEAAEELLKKSVKIIGIDYISVDKYCSIDLPVHHLFLSNNILIVEGLELSEAPIGRANIYVIPNNIPNMDGLPVRVIVETLV